MNYIVLDLEWNQGTGGKRGQLKEMPFEIIEIGAIKMDSQFNVIGEFNQIICPSVYTNMHRVTQKLIQIEMEELERGRPFQEVFAEFCSWCGEDYMFCTWGPLDLIELQRNMRYYRIPAFSDRPFPFLDVQKIFAIGFEDKTARHTLEYAVDFLNIEKDIPFHRAFSDSYYTAKVLAKCPKEALAYVSYDVFSLPRNKSQEVHVTFPDYVKHISRLFKSKDSIMADREIMSTKCFRCQKLAKRKIKWFTPNGKHYLSVSYCPDHGYLKAKIRIKKDENGKLYVVKTMRFITDEEVAEIVAKRNLAKQKNMTKPAN